MGMLPAKKARKCEQVREYCPHRVPHPLLLNDTLSFQRRCVGLQVRAKVLVSGLRVDHAAHRLPAKPTVALSCLPVRCDLAAVAALKRSQRSRLSQRPLAHKSLAQRPRRLTRICRSIEISDYVGFSWQPAGSTTTLPSRSHCLYVQEDSASAEVSTASDDDMPLSDIKVQCPPALKQGS